MFDLNKIDDDMIATIFQIRLNIFIIPIAIAFYSGIIMIIDNQLEDLAMEDEDGPEDFTKADLTKL